MVIERQTIKKLLDFLNLTIQQANVMEFSPEEFFTNPDIHQLLDRRLELAIEACMDIASHIAAGLNLPDRATPAKVFETLGKHGILTQTLAGKFKSIVGLRNILVHRYIDIDHALILKDYEEDLKDLRKFAKAIVVFLEKNPHLTD